MKTARILVLMPVLALSIMAFRLDNAIVPRNEILSGGPPKDGIPAILNPHIIASKAVGFLDPDDEVIGVLINGEARAYPINILNWHEVVNDHVQGVPIAVTF